MNVCCDEPWELGKGRSRRRADRVGAGQVYLEFLLRLHKLCARHGKRMNMWGDIVLEKPELIPQFPKDVVMLNWNYSAKGSRIPRTREFHEAGLPVVVCPGTSGWQRHGTDMPNAIGNVANFACTGRRYAAEGLLNTDWGDYGHRNPLGVSLHGYAHGAAHSWHGRGVDDGSFTRTFARQYFGDAALAEPLTALGRAGAMATAGRDSSCLYHAVVEPVQLPANRFVKRFRRASLVAHYPSRYPGAIVHCDPEGLQWILDTLGAPKFWPVVPKGLAEFEQQALADCRLATTMDLLAAERAVLAQTHRGGASVSAAEWRGWADAMAAMRKGFEGLWRLRFRPSRLADNLKLMRWAEEECRTLGKVR